MSRFFADPHLVAEEISGNVVGPQKMPGVNFTSIQEALDHSDPGETVYVLSGEYNESLNLSKPGVILKGVNTGSGAPMVFAVGDSSTITVSADACTIDGFVVMNSGAQESGIAVLSDRNLISNNVITNNEGQGLELTQSSDNIIQGNSIENNGLDGIYLEGSTDNLITSNSVTENGMNGLHLEDSDRNTIRGCLSINNNQEGILLVNSNSNIITNNSYDSIREEKSRNNIIEGNKVLSQEDTPDDYKADDPEPELPILPPEPSPVMFILVGPGESIQKAIDLISPGGIIEILSGEYDETLNVNKEDITLLGMADGVGPLMVSEDDLPVVLGDGVKSTITLLSSGVTIDGLVVTDSGNPHAGIDVRASDCIIRDCRIRDDNGYGISLTSSQGSRITENTIANNGLGGIILQSCQNCQIDRNSIGSNKGYGIDVSSSTGNSIFLNNFNNARNARDSGSGNRWNSPQAISYVYYSRAFSIPLGNHWSDFSGTDGGGDGVGDTPYSLGVGSARDMYPLIKPWPFQEPPLSISGSKFVDRNGNGARDPEDHGLSNWTIRLAGPGGYNKTADTNESGSYRFAGLGAGRYTVSEEMKPGYSQTHPGHSGIHNVTLLESSKLGADFGNCRNDLCISGYKLDACTGEGLPGREIRLASKRGVVMRNSTTDENGRYSFCGLHPGDYLLGEIHKDGWMTIDTPPMVTVAGDNVTNQNFTNQKLLCIRGYDIDDCTGEGRPGWNYTLTNGSYTATATTGSDGKYEFCGLIPGDYTLTESLKGGWIPIPPPEIKVTLVCEDFTLENFTVRERQCISGYKLDDRTKAGIANWTITLNNSTYSTSMITDPNGKYEFRDLVPGNYTVTEETRDGWISKSPVTLGVLLPCGSDLVNQNFTNRKSHWTVCKDVSCDYTIIQDAINAASPGDTVLVYSGTYYENVNVNKKLTLQGADTGSGLPVVNADGSGSAITISADGCTVVGFEARNSGNTWPCAGIHVTSNDNSISGNTATNNKWDGISLKESSGNTISGNILTSNTASGIYLQSSNNNAIENNIATGNGHDGIKLQECSNTTISGNMATGNVDGIYLYYSSGNTVLDNTASDNNCGIFLYSSSGNTVSDNTATGNTYGISLGSSSNSNNISDNTANDNDGDGIRLDSSSGNTISGNTVTNNKWDGIRLDGSSGNTISGNILTRNAASGVCLRSSGGNTIAYNTATGNGQKGIILGSSADNVIRGNDLIGNIESGVMLESSSNNNTIMNNTAADNYLGIFLLNSNGNTVYDNIATGNTLYGIHLTSSTGNTISENTVSGNSRDGINLSSSSDNVIEENAFIDNDKGIHLYSSSNNIISGNTANINFFDGIRLDGSRGNTISGNILSDNVKGIILGSSADNIIRGNVVQFNWDSGVMLESSSNNTISGNNVINNLYGIHLDSASGNIIYLNALNNTNNSWSNSENDWNSIETMDYTYNGSDYNNYTGNYWSNYHGNDTNKDGIGDQPYSIGGGTDKDNYPMIESLPQLKGALGIQISLEGTLQAGKPSSNAQYLMKITNLGDSEITDINIKDHLFQGIESAFVDEGQEPDVSLEEEGGAWTLQWHDSGPLGPGETKSIGLVALLEGELPETLISQAYVEATSSTGEKLSDEDVLELNAAANITIEKEADPIFAQPSDPVTFNINITNTGQVELASMIVNDTLPQGISYASDDSNGAVSGRHVSWADLGPLEPGDSKFISLMGKVDEDASGVQTNTVSVNATTEKGSSVFASDTASVDILSLNVSKEADKKTVKRGENITYTITICNSGSLPLEDVIAWDAMDSRVILLYSSLETEEDGKWHLGSLAPGECAVITLMVHVPDVNFRFDMTSSVSGEGYVNVVDDYSTTLPEFVIKNTVYALSANTSRQSEDTSLVTVLGEAGTELSNREHGSGSYQGEEQLTMITENKSIEMNKSVTARHQPITLSLYGARTLNQSSPWTERTSARNSVTGLSMTESFSHAENISRESRVKLDENESVMESSTEFDGLGRIGARKKSEDGRGVLLDAQEDYAGSFKVYGKIDEYGSGVNFKKFASGTGIVAAEKRIGKSQKSHESGTGNYSSEEELQTYTNYIYKDIDLASRPVDLNLTGRHWQSRSLLWREGIWSRDPGSTYLGEEYSSLESMKKQTLVAGLSYIRGEANFTGSARYRQAIEGQLDLDQQYLGKYAIKYKASLQGTARYDRPHINVIKSGEVIKPENQTQTYAKYIITVENDGNKMLSPIYIKDLFPPGALYVNSTLRPDLADSSANWSLTHLAVGSSSEITLWLEIGDDLSNRLVNRVEATGSYYSGWVSASNLSVLESGWLSYAPAAEDLLVVKKSAYVNGSAGDFAWYLLRIENHGNCTPSLTVTDILPQGMNLIQSTPDVNSYDHSSNTVMWNILDLQPQGTTTIIYKVQVTRGGRLVNQVKVEAVSPEGCEMKPAYDSTVLIIKKKSNETALDDWSPPDEWDIQCLGSSCP